MYASLYLRAQVSLCANLCVIACDIVCVCVNAVCVCVWWDSVGCSVWCLCLMCVIIVCLYLWSEFERVVYAGARRCVWACRCICCLCGVCVMFVCACGFLIVRVVCVCVVCVSDWALVPRMEAADVNLKCVLIVFSASHSQRPRLYFSFLYLCVCLCSHVC